MKAAAPALVDATASIRTPWVRTVLVAGGSVAAYVGGEYVERSLRAECRPCGAILDAARPLLDA